MITAARFIANDVISIVPLLAVALWLWGPRKQLNAQRQLVIKVTMAMAISMSLSLLLGHLFPTTVHLSIMSVTTFCPIHRITRSRAITVRSFLPLPLPLLPGIGPGPARC
jgi:uncharacterized membrane protein